MREKIERRITELERERDQFVQQATTQVAAYNAVIGELKRLVESPAESNHREGVVDARDE